MRAHSKQFIDVEEWAGIYIGNQHISPGSIRVALHRKQFQANLSKKIHFLSATIAGLALSYRWN